MNKQARNWVPALVLLVMIVFGFWFVSRQMTRDYSYTEQAFQQDIEEGEHRHCFLVLRPDLVGQPLFPICSRCCSSLNI